MVQKVVFAKPLYRITLLLMAANDCCDALTSKITHCVINHFMQRLDNIHCNCCHDLPASHPESYLLCRWGCSSQRCIWCWHSEEWGHITISLSSRFLTSKLEGRHCCNCSLRRSTGQKSCSFKKLLRQWKQYVWPQGVSIGLRRGCRQMWQTSSSSTSSWYSYRWLSGPSCTWPHSLHTRAHDRPGVLLLLAALVSVVAIGWRWSVQNSLEMISVLLSPQELWVVHKSMSARPKLKSIQTVKVNWRSRAKNVISMSSLWFSVERENKVRSPAEVGTVPTRTGQLHRKWQIHRAAAIWQQAAAASSQLVSWGTKGILISAKNHHAPHWRG